MPEELTNTPLEQMEKLTWEVLTHILTHIRKNDIATFKRAVTKDNVDFYDDGHWTLLHHACDMQINCADNCEFVRYLVQECDVNVDVVNRDQRTVLNVSIACGFLPNCTKELLRLRANVNTRGSQTLSTPIQLALRMHNKIECTFIVQLLLEHGAILPEGSPLWAKRIARARRLARRNAILIIGLKRYRRSKVLQSNNKDAIGMISRFVWESRSRYNKWCNN